jgi:hypothetical protein
VGLDITELLLNNYNFGTIIICALFILIGGGLKTLIDEIIKKKVGSKNKQCNKKDAYEIVDLIEVHPLFDDLKWFKDVKVPNCKIGGPVRTLIFRNCLTIYYETFIEEATKLLHQNIDGENFLRVNEQFEHELITAIRANLYKADIPEVVIKKFQSWYITKHEHLLRYFSDIHSSVIVTSLVEKEHMVLSLLRETAYFTLLDAEKTLKSLNGSLTGVVYQGQIVEDSNYYETHKS